MYCDYCSIENCSNGVVHQHYTKTGTIYSRSMSRLSSWPQRGKGYSARCLVNLSSLFVHNRMSTGSTLFSACTPPTPTKTVLLSVTAPIRSTYSASFLVWGRPSMGCTLDNPHAQTVLAFSLVEFMLTAVFYCFFLVQVFFFFGAASTPCQRGNCGCSFWYSNLLLLKYAADCRSWCHDNSHKKKWCFQNHRLGIYFPPSIFWGSTYQKNEFHLLYCNFCTVKLFVPGATLGLKTY